MVLVVKSLLKNAGDIRDASLISGSGACLGRGHDNPLQYSCLENPVDRGALWATVHGVARVEHDLVTKPSPAAHVHTIFRSKVLNIE